MPPSLAWGLGLGLLIAAIDTVAALLAGSGQAANVPIGDLDQIANVVLYSLIGFQVGRRTGVVREAAEAGVVAALLVAAIGTVVAMTLPMPSGGIRSVGDVVGIFAINIAIGGTLAIVTGWAGSRAAQDVRNTRR